MMSILVSSRVDGNPDSNIDALISSTIYNREPGEKVEFLIKYDSDDTKKHDDNYFKNYPIPIRTFTWGRMEGRHSLHTTYEYLFTNIHECSRLIMIGSDDFVFTRRGFITEAFNVMERYCMITGTGTASHFVSNGTFNCHAGPADDFYKFRYDYRELKADVYRKAVFNRYKNMGLVIPIFSRELLEVAQNFGWQANSDSWMLLLESIFWDMFGIKLLKFLPVWYARTGRIDSGYRPPFYNRMELHGISDDIDETYIRLLRKQAVNLYLNLVSRECLKQSHLV